VYVAVAPPVTVSSPAKEGAITREENRIPTNSLDIFFIVFPLLFINNY
jgi:hypothetical protein